MDSGARAKRAVGGPPRHLSRALQLDITARRRPRGRSHDWKKAGAAGWMAWRKWKSWWSPSWWDRYGRRHREREALKHLGYGYYRYNWKTSKDYAGSCKALHLDLGDGMTHTALFYFSRYGAWAGPATRHQRQTQP